jgi:hypothetical protein
MRIPEVKNKQPGIELPRPQPRQVTISALTESGGFNSLSLDQNTFA